MWADLCLLRFICSLSVWGRWRQHEAALLRRCLRVGLCVPGNGPAALPHLQGRFFSLAGPRHVVPQHFPRRPVDAVRVWEPLGRWVGRWVLPAQRADPQLSLCFWLRGQQGTGSGPAVEERRGAGRDVFPGGGTESETCHTAKQTLSTFLKTLFFFFKLIHRCVILILKDLTYQEHVLIIMNWYKKCNEFNKGLETKNIILKLFFSYKSRNLTEKLLR